LASSLDLVRISYLYEHSVLEGLCSDLPCIRCTATQTPQPSPCRADLQDAYRYKPKKTALFFGAIDFIEQFVARSPVVLYRQRIHTYTVFLFGTV
jgi:hypothetical protein